MWFLDKNAWKLTCRFNYKPNLCQNTELPSNVMHLTIPSRECWTLCRAASSSGTAWVGNAWAMSVASLAILAIFGNDDMTSHLQIFKAWSMFGLLIPVYDILISSQSCHSAAPNWHTLNYWLTYTMADGRHLFADGFVTVMPIAMKFRWN